jgi:hypothetical protein
MENIDQLLLDDFDNLFKHFSYDKRYEAQTKFLMHLKLYIIKSVNDAMNNGTIQT